MLLICKTRTDKVYQAIIQPLGARLKIGVTSFRYDLDVSDCVFKLQAGGVVYTITIKQSAANAIQYASTKREYVWCDAISVSFLRLLDPSRGNQVFINMAKVYKFYTCIPSLNWVIDHEYCRRGWMWQEYICGELLLCDRVDQDTLAEVLRQRQEKDPSPSLILQRKKMTVKLIADLLTSCVRHYIDCEITREDDLPNACFGLLKSYGLFVDLPHNLCSLDRFANKSIAATSEFSLHPIRLSMRVLIKVLKERRGIECAVQFANSKEGQRTLAFVLNRGTGAGGGVGVQKKDQTSTPHTELHCHGAQSEAELIEELGDHKEGGD